MYEAFYGLREKPFNLTPDPRYLYLSEKHKEAFAHLLFGIKNRSGFVMVSGEIGTGKTTICRTLLNQLDDNTEVAFIFNPFLSPAELLRSINSEFGIRSRAENVLGLVDELNQYLLQAAARGKNCVLVIDEAQNLEPGVLEHIRLLSNLETETQKLLQIVLIGQPELAEHLALPELRQLNQRITARYHLHALNKEETLQYIAYRLRVAGGRRKVRFSRRAINSIYRQSKGTPRVINAICDRAMLIGYTKETRDISARIVRQAAREIRGERVRVRHMQRQGSSGQQWWKPLVAGAAAVAVAAAVYTYAPAILEYQRQAERSVNSDTAREANATESSNRLTPLPVEAATRDDDAAESRALTEVAAPATLEDRIAAIPGADTRRAASGHLLRRWNLALLGAGPADDTPESLVEFVRENGLEAEVLNVGMEHLAALNLPAFIRINLEPEQRWVALAELTQDSAAITADSDKPENIGREKLAAIYAGEAIVPWRDPEPSAEALRQGQEGKAVSDLQRQLQMVQLLGDTVTGFYGSQTALAVERLQRETGLTVDGVAGRQTRMVLSSWLSNGLVPTLGERELTFTPVNEASTTQTAAASLPEESPPAQAPSAEPAVPEPSNSEPTSGNPQTETEPAEPLPQPGPEPKEPLDNAPSPDTGDNAESSYSTRTFESDVTEPAVGFLPLVPSERRESVRPEDTSR